MTRVRRRLGAEAEEIAARHLEAKGYRIVDRNRRLGRLGEIDLVVRDGETTVLVEVRAGRRFDPLESIGPAKRRRLVRLARAYAAARGLLDRPLRIDCVGVSLGGEPAVVHVENAVEGGA